MTRTYGSMEWTPAGWVITRLEPQGKSHLAVPADQPEQQVHALPAQEALL